MKKEETTKEPSFIYNPENPQEIPLEITFKGKPRRIVHKLAPLSDERYFQLEKERRDAQKRMVKSENISTVAYAANETLWNDLAIEVTGFAPDPEWKTKTYFLDKTNAISALLHTQTVEEESESDDEILTYDVEFDVNLNVLQSGVLIQTTHTFREELKSEMDEYLLIMSNKPKTDAMAKFARPNESVAERLCDLYDACIKRFSPYEDRVPAWHKTQAVSVHFARQFSRMGKF